MVMENISLSSGLQKPLEICMKTLDKFALSKKNISEILPFMNRLLSRAHKKKS